MNMTHLLHPKLFALLIAISFVFSGCGDSKENDPDRNGPDTEAPDENCNPAGHSIDCFYPFPSNAFRVEKDDRTQVVFEGDARFKYNKRNVALSVNNPIDGFAIHTPIFADLGEPIDPSQLIFHDDDLNKTLLPTSPVIILHGETHEPVAHFVELDRTVAENNRTILQIRLLRALEENTRYIVAIQNIKNTSGQTIARPASFQNLAFEESYPYFQDAQQNTREHILPALQDFGVNLDDVQIAWDFTTRSNQTARHELESMIEQSVAWMDENDLNLRITNVTEYRAPDSDSASQLPEHANLRYNLEALVDVPLFLTDDTPEGRMIFDDAGLPRFESTVPLAVNILIPHSVVAEGASKATIQFGHGFFGSTEEMRGSFMTGFLNENQMVSAGIKWWGLSDDDMVPIVGKINSKPSEVFNFTERLMQGFVNQTVVARAMQQIPDDFSADTDTIALDLRPYLQNQRHVFYGISLGHILGSTAIAVSPEITDGILSVGGGSFTFIMSRAKPFEPLIGLVNMGLTDKRDAQKFVAISSLAMEKVDPITYADQLLSNTFNGATIERRILGQVGLGDPDVPTLSAFVWARSANIPIGQKAPAVFAADYDVEKSTLPEDKSVMMIFDFDLEGTLPGTYAEFSKNSNTVHNDVRNYSKGQIQALDLIFNRPISDICNGEVCIAD